MRVLEKYVLIEQTMIKKKTAIITDAARDERDKFDFSFRILQKGKDCEREFEVGEIPIFGQHVSFNGLKVIEKDDNGMISHIIVHEGDIIGVDDEPEIENKVS